MLAAMESANSATSCGTSEMRWRRASRSVVRTSMPSTRTRPCCGSKKRSSSENKVDLPAPEGPTTASVSPGLTRSEKPLSVDATELMVRWAQVEQAREDSDDVIHRGKDLLKLYVGGWPRADGNWLNTDDFPRVEFLAPITHRDRVKLTKQRLVDYYCDVLLNLPLTGLEYAPLAAEPMPDLAAGRLLQRDSVPLD